jgi:hypothetical protein
MRVDHVVDVARCLDAASIQYLVAGGLAVNAHGYVRYTNDLDLVVSLETENIRGALEALGRLGYRPRVPVSAAEFADSKIRERWIKDKGMVVLNLWCEERRETPIVVFVREPFDFPSEWKAAVRFPIAEGITLPVVTLATLLRIKREAGRPQDLLDINELTVIDQIRHET